MSSSGVFVLYLSTVETSVEGLKLSVPVHLSTLLYTYEDVVGNH